MSHPQRALDVGDRAPDFRLRHTLGTEVGRSRMTSFGFLSVRNP